MLGIARRISRAIRRMAGLSKPTTVAEVRLSWEEQRDREAALAVASIPADYKRYHQAQAARWLPLQGKRVLVLGCNRGEDCEYFIKMCADCVVGIDVMDEIGKNFEHHAVRYIKASAEQIPVDASSFDLVFAYATLEHVPDIRRAFAEMARLAVTGGFIYSAAAPLWCTRSGPHWGGAFDHDPWPHLRMNTEEIVQLAVQAREAGRSNEYYDAARIRHHMNDLMLFNRRKSYEYLDACICIEGIKIIRNEIQTEDQTNFDPKIAELLISLGYTTFDLFGLTHLFIARRQ